MVAPGVLDRDIARNKIPKKPIARVIDLVKEAFSEWKEDNASRLSASLAYYTTFSMAPLLVLIITITGLIAGREAVQNQVMAQVEGLLGSAGRDFFESMLISASLNPERGIVATLIGLAALLFGALGVFGELQNSLNTIWEVKPLPAKNIKESIFRFFFRRLLSFTMVLSVGFVLIVSLAISSVLATLGSVIGNLGLFSDAIVQIINFLISLGVITFLFAIMFKYLPDAEISWRDVWLGALITSLLFNLGKFAIGLYLGRSSVGTTFGAAGSLALLLIWVYYSAQIFFLGAEFTQVYANNYGSHIIPDEDAVKVTEEERAEQGIPHQKAFEKKS
jgi:membrane protein